MKKKVVKVVGVRDGFIIQAKRGSKTIEIRPTRGGYADYVSPESAQRAWRRYAAKNNVSNYAYQHAY